MSKIQKTSKKKYFFLFTFLLTIFLIEVLSSSMLLYYYRSNRLTSHFENHNIFSIPLYFEKFSTLIKNHNSSQKRLVLEKKELLEISSDNIISTIEKYDLSKLSNPYPLYQPDDYLGFKYNQGQYEIIIRKKVKKKNNYFKFNTLINKDGSRYTGNYPKNYTGTIYIFGDSFIHGEGVNDEQTLGFLVQNKYKNYRVKLFAVGGYSTVQAYLNFKKFKKNITKNDIIILGYGDFYKVRDMAAPSRIKVYGAPSRVMINKNAKHAKASLDINGEIKVEYISIFCQLNDNYCSKKDPSLTSMNILTSSLINYIANNTEARIFLLHFRGPKTDPVLNMIKKNIKIIHATKKDLFYFSHDTIMDFDGHPGPFWHYAMHEKIYSAINKY